MSDTATRSRSSGRPVGPKPFKLRDLGESGSPVLHCSPSTLPQSASTRRISRHLICSSRSLSVDFLYRIMEQPHCLPQSAPSSVSIPPIQLYFLSFHIPSQAQGSVYISDSTHNLNGNPTHSQAAGPNQSEELYKRSVMLVIWYKVSWSTSFQFRSFMGHLASYDSSPPLAPSAHLPVPSAFSVSLPPLIALPKPKFVR